MTDENHSLLKGSIPITAKNCTLKLISSVMIQPVDSILWHSYTVGVRDRSSYPHCCEAQLTCWWELSVLPPFCLSIHCSVSLIGLSAPVHPECTHTHIFAKHMYICTTCTHTSTGEPQTFTVRVSPSANYPLDLYILMDLSSSMSDDLNMVKSLSSQLGEWNSAPPLPHLQEYNRPGELRVGF